VGKEVAKKSRQQNAMKPLTAVGVESQSADSGGKVLCSASGTHSVKEIWDQVTGQGWETHLKL
jgi:hypothetical protein